MSSATSLTVLLLTAVLFSGCTKKAEEKKEEGPKKISFTNKVEVVKAEEITIVAEDQRVKADFNLDGIPDLAVVDPEAGTDGEVSIYIRVPKEEEQVEPGEEDKAGTEELAQYYVAGRITEFQDGTISGLASSRRKNFIDLIMLVTYADGRGSRMIHYQNDGTNFTEVPITTDEELLEDPNTEVIAY